MNDSGARAEEAANRAEEIANRMVARLLEQSARVDRIEGRIERLFDGHACTRKDKLDSLDERITEMSKGWTAMQRIIVGAAITIVMAVLAACYSAGRIAQQVESQAESIQRIERMVEVKTGRQEAGKVSPPVVVSNLPADLR
jgi:hypothetical protein